MNIFKQIKNSIYNPIYYKNIVLNETLKDSLKYLAKVSLVAALAGVILFSFTLPVFYKTVKMLVDTEVANYPEDLVINIKGGVVSTNKPEPFAIKLSQPSKDLNKSNTGVPENVLVIDTTKSFNVDSFASYSTLALLTNNSIIISKDNIGNLQVISLSKSKDTQITKSYLSSIESKLFKYLPLIFVTIIVFVFVALFIGYFAVTLLLLIVYAFLIWLIMKLKGLNFTYKDSYKVGIHASTILIVLSILGMFAPVLGSLVIKTVAILLVVYINLFPDTTIEEEVKVIE